MMNDIEHGKIDEIAKFVDKTVNENREEKDTICHITMLFIPQEDGTSVVHHVSNADGPVMVAALRSSLKALDEAAMPTDPVESHNEIVKQILLKLMDHPLRNGGMQGVLTVLESVITGVVLTNVKYGGRAEVIDVLANAVRDRVGKQALADSPAAGNA